MKALVYILEKQIIHAGTGTFIATVIDIIFVAALIYWLIIMSKRTRAWHIILGLGAFVVLELATDYAQLHTINYLLRSFIPLGPVAIVLLFYPELRSVLENLGRVAGKGRGLAGLAGEESIPVIDTIVEATATMSSKKIGALIVIERQNALEDIASTGTKIDAQISEDIIGAIFYPGNPLHDGATIVQGDRVYSAGCTLPLSESVGVGASIHTRHKAALGLAEISDAVVVVVSEETGTISLAHDSKLHRGLNGKTLSEQLKVTLGIAEENRVSQVARKINGITKKKKDKKQ